MPPETMRIQCPECGAKINAPARMAGRKASCPKCSAEIAVPAKAEPEPDEFAMAAPTPPVNPFPFEVAAPDPDDFEDAFEDRPQPVRRSSAEIDPTDRRMLFGVDLGAAALNERFPNLTAYLVLIQIAVAIVTGTIITSGLFVSIFVSVLSRADWFTRAGFGLFVFASVCLLAWIIKMCGMASVELVRVLLQIELNTRSFLKAGQ
jgi:DNA-directed RNA polymerase subunit RPC12/RpoP